MCIVSNIGDTWGRTFPHKYPQWPNPFERHFFVPPTITRDEFDELKKDVSELKELLKAAKKYDEATGQPNCETDEKMKVLRAVAKELGINLEI